MSEPNATKTVDDQTDDLALSSGAIRTASIPRWMPYVLLAAAAVVGIALSFLITGGFNVVLFLLFGFLIFLFAWTGVSWAKLGARKGRNIFWMTMIAGAFALALLPLLSVVWTVLSNGVPGLLNPGFLASDMQGVIGRVDQETVQGEHGVLGGIKHALIGTLMITLLATLISVPIGLLTSIYLVEYSNGGPFSRAITFFVDVMTGIPSIVAGLFAAAVIVPIVGIQAATAGFSAAIALAVLMIPVVVRSTEEMLRVVPNELREASFALGVRKWRTILRVVIPTSISGIASGVTLAIARVTGETAPILLTAGLAYSVNWNPFFEGRPNPMMTLPVYIYRQLISPTAPGAPGPSLERAWGAALVLIIIVMGLNGIARLVAWKFAPKTGR
ncbi:phosphate ABC transporter permease PstA [Enemella sp. A6]|uniref:phosphate ABC transporter permease PstA n=1 Tax=Enemella sp. A6 TaxID=3440152 RepID=UPI003EBE3CDE